MLYNNVLVSARHQHESVVGMHMSPPSCNSLPAPTPICRRAPDLSSLHHTSHFHWLSNFAYGNVYISTLPSQFIPPSPSQLCPQFCSLCLHLYYCPANSSSYHVSRFHIYALYEICFSLSDLLHSV